MINIQKISIIGLGFIGGSIAKALKRANSNYYITGMDINYGNIRPALKEGIINRAATCPKDAAQDSDLIFLCTPVESIPEHLMEIKDAVQDGAIITDVGSTKKKIMETADKVFGSRAIFIGGHPMAGTELSGYRAGIPHLFENAYYLLTPSKIASDQAINSLSSLLSSIGALPMIMDADFHDRIIGSISHLPHVVAAALVNTVKDMEDPKHCKEKLAAGGFRDITRIASSNPAMWRDISFSNHQELGKLISSMIDNLQKFIQYLKQNNREEVNDFFTRAKQFRDSLPTLQSLVLLPYHELYVDVEDRPGVIGEVATLLGMHNINIKNLRIINSREDEPGCLVISLADYPSLDKAIVVLKKKGYKTYKR